MVAPAQFWTPADLVEGLKAAAEPTRLRMLVLLAAGDLNVKDFTQVLGQSQPRISRHLKLLVDAGLIERFREGSRVYFHLAPATRGGTLARHILGTLELDDPGILRDKFRVSTLKREREAAAQVYFAVHAADWDRIRALHVAERDVDIAIEASIGPGPFRFLLDLGTGTGRILELLAKRCERALGIDVNGEMLAYARSKLSEKNLLNAHVRQGDLYNLPLDQKSADVVVMHQVLHFLADPARAIREAARVLSPGGHLLIVDFAPHDLEFLRDNHAHERLGIAPAQMATWLKEGGLAIRRSQRLEPPDRDDAKLTVLVWLAQRPAEHRVRKSGRTSPLTLEETR